MALTHQLLFSSLLATISSFAFAANTQLKDATGPIYVSPPQQTGTAAPQTLNQQTIQAAPAQQQQPQSPNTERAVIHVASDLGISHAPPHGTVLSDSEFMLWFERQFARAANEDEQKREVEQLSSRLKVSDKLIDAEELDTVLAGVFDGRYAAENRADACLILRDRIIISRADAVKLVRNQRLFPAYDREGGARAYEILQSIAF